MRRFCSYLILAALALGLAGCGDKDSKPIEPKAPDGAPKLQPQTPNGGGGPGGKKSSGPAGKPE